MNRHLPAEITEFEKLLRKPNSDPTGFAGFFNSGEVWVARVPARLDVMGGIADYSGAQRFDFGVPDDFVASVLAFRHLP